MTTTNLEKLEFVNLMKRNFPHTFFHWWFEIDKKPKSTCHKTYEQIENKFVFVKKEKILRTNLWNADSDEIRFDFDHKNLEDNFKDIRKVIEKLLQLNITKFETYLSGGKGLHLQLRYDFSPFFCHDMQDVRKAFFKSLNLDVKIDESLFRTNQMIGLEGYNHRKTNNPKQRIKIDYEDYKILDKPINLNYLKQDYVNQLDQSFISEIKRNLKLPVDTPRHSIKISENKNYDKEKLQKHVDRFHELYLTISDGKKRLLDTLTRYLWLTTHSQTSTKTILRDFFTTHNIKHISVDERLKLTLKSMKSPAIFIYKDVLTKEQFYQGWDLNSVAHNELVSNEQKKTNEV